MKRVVQLACARGYTVRAGDLALRPGRKPHEHAWAGAQNGGGLLCPASGRSIGYERLRGASGGLAAWLSANVGGALGVLLPNSIEMVVTCLGALEAGVPIAPMNPESSTEEISTMLRGIETDWVVTKSTLVHNILEAKRAVEEQRKEEYPLGIITIDDDITFSGVCHFVDLTETKGNVERRGETALVTQKWTKNGVEKVEVSSESLLAGCLQAGWEDLRPGERLLSCVPMFTRYGLCQSVLAGLAAGAQLVIGGDIAAVGRHRAAAAAAISSALGGIAGAELGGLRELAVCGQLGQAPEGVSVTQHYGPPGGPVVFSERQAGRARLGQPVRGTEARVTAGGGEVGPMCEGEIWVRGPQLGAAWSSTGDLGYYDPEGTFYLTRRGSLEVAGQPVWPEELEAALVSHPQVAGAAVFGAGSGLVAAVVPADSFSPPAAQELKKWLAARTSPHKRLADVVFTAALPHLPDGTLDRAILAARYAAPNQYVAVAYV